MVDGTDYYVRDNGSGDMILDVVRSQSHLDDKYQMLQHIFNTKNVNTNLKVYGKNILYYTSLTGVGSSPEIISLLIEKGYDYKTKYPDKIDEQYCHSMFSNLCQKNDERFLKTLEMLLPYTDINQFYDVKLSSLDRMINRLLFTPSTKIVEFLITNGAKVSVDIIRRQVGARFRFSYGMDDRIVNNMLSNNAPYLEKITQLPCNNYQITNILGLLKYHIKSDESYEQIDDLLKETRIYKSINKIIDTFDINIETDRWSITSFYEYGLSIINKKLFKRYQKRYPEKIRSFHELYLSEIKWILQFYLKVVDLICYKNRSSINLIRSLKDEYTSLRYKPNNMLLKIQKIHFDIMSGKDVNTIYKEIDSDVVDYLSIKDVNDMVQKVDQYVL